MKHVGKAAVSLLAVALLLSGCGGSSAPEPPQDYVIGENSLPSLNSLVTLDNDFQYQLSSSGEDDADIVTYVYSQLSSGGITAAAYTNALETDYGCTVGTEKSPGVAPVFSNPSGQAIVLQTPDDSDECFMLTVQWEETSCSITPSLVPRDEIIQPTENEATVETAVQYMESLSPAYLGLSGSSMEQYTVIPQDGLVRLDEQACLCVNVYLSETHQFQQSYLLTLPALQVYSLDRTTGHAALLG